MAGIDGYCKLMLHMNGADESTTFTDSSASAHTVTPVGTAQIDTAQYKWTASGLFDGNSDYLTVPDHADWAFGTGAVSVDFWVRFSDLTGAQGLFGQYVDADNYAICFKNSDHRIHVQLCVSGSVIGAYYTTNVPSINVDTWYHIEITRNGSDFYMFLDGTSQALTVDTDLVSDSWPDLAGVFMIGYFAVTYYIKGHIDEFRVSKGIARHTSNFTSPTVEYSQGEASLTEGIVVSDSFALSGPLSISDGVEVNDTFGLSELKALAEGVSVSGTFGMSESKSLTEAIVAGDSWNITSLKSVWRYRRRIA